MRDRERLREDVAHRSGRRFDDAAGGIDGPLPGLHFAPKAKRVIYLFQSGGPSHIDTFDPKPLLHKYAGKNLPTENLRTERPTSGLLNVPFALVGGAIGLWLVDMPVSLAAAVGFDFTAGRLVLRAEVGA